MTLIDGLTQGYDLSGNVTLAYSTNLGTSYVYKYDHNNRLTGVYDDTGTTRKAAFTYDALGRRIEHVNDVLDSTTRYYYDGVNEIVETDVVGGAAPSRLDKVQDFVEVGAGGRNEPAVLRLVGLGRFASPRHAGYWAWASVSSAMQ